MEVVGANATVIEEMVFYAGVNNFANDVSRMKRVTTKDILIAYNFPYQQKTFLLIVKNSFHVPSMNHNLIPPFILYESGLEVDAKPNIHSKNLTV